MLICSSVPLAGTSTRVDMLLLLSVAMVFTFYKTNKCDPGYIPLPLSPRDEYRVRPVCQLS